MPQRYVFICHLFLEFSHFIFMKDSDLQRKKSVLFQAVSSFRFYPTYYHILVSSEVFTTPKGRYEHHYALHHLKECLLAEIYSAFSAIQFPRCLTLLLGFLVSGVLY